MRRAASLGTSRIITATKLQRRRTPLTIKTERDIIMVEFDESKHPRDEQGKFTSGGAKEYRQNTPYEQLMSIKELDLMIDEVTPCLRRVDNGEIVKTKVERVDISQLNLREWEFDWSDASLKECEIYALQVEGDGRIHGLIACFPEDKDYKAVIVQLVEAAPFNNKHNINNKSGRKEYEGVGAHLFAEAVKQSYAYGFEGYVFFRAKTLLISHYKEELGAEEIDGSKGTMVIRGISAKELYEKYYGS